jgi:hypothetical protein
VPLVVSIVAVMVDGLYCSRGLLFPRIGLPGATESDHGPLVAASL